MPKRSEKRDTAKAEYCARRAAGKEFTLAAFAEEMGVDASLLRRWKRDDKWEEAVPRKRGGQPGNRNSKGKRNAKGNPGGGAPAGNRNAEKDGAYSRVFLEALTDEERAMLDTLPTGGVESMRHELKILKYRENKILLLIREYEAAPQDELLLTSVLDMRKPGGRGAAKQDGESQTLGMYSKETPFARVLKLQEALYKVQGRIASVSNALRQAEEFDRRMELEHEKLEVARMRATGVVDVPVEIIEESEEEDAAVHGQGGGPVPQPLGEADTPTEG